jgi:hypothetical protein
MNRAGTPGTPDAARPLLRLDGANAHFNRFARLHPSPFSSLVGWATREPVFLVGLGVAFPLAVLAALLAYGPVIGERLLLRVADDLVTVRAEALQWEWSFGYADALVWINRPNPADHVCDATLWLLAGHVVLHAGLTAIMVVYLAARVATGFASLTRIGEARMCNSGQTSPPPRGSLVQPRTCGRFVAGWLSVRGPERLT